MRTILAVGMMMLLGLSSIALAKHLPAPQHVTCSVTGGIIQGTWDPVPGAAEYRVVIKIRYEPQPGVVTSEREVVRESSVASLSLDLAELTSEKGMPAAQVRLRVRAKSADEKQGRRYSTWCHAL